MQEYFFSIYLDYEQCLDFYNGSIKFVQVIEDNGKRIRFPVIHVRKFISSIGIRGRFRLCLDEKSAFISLEKIA